MLTIFALTNAAQAAKYYEEDNYYHKGSIESIAATHWWGKGAELLGLSDYVDPEKFVELLKGNITPDVKLERIRHDGGVGHKPGYDLTFSAPKSVSMLAEIGKDFRIYDAHNNAVNKALEYLQSRATRYRHTVDSDTQTKQSNNLIVAKFRHDTSRSVEDTIDCQLHTHCVVANATQGQDGKWRSLSEKPLFDFKMVGGMIYRSALAKELKELGYDIQKTREDGLFEIAGFSRSQIEEFSKRRVKILEVMKEQGLFGAEAAQKVMLNLRENKTPIDRQKLDEHWQERIQELGIDLDILIQASKAQEPHVDKRNAAPYLVADEALSYAIAHLGERQSAFKEKDILLTSLQYALGNLLMEDIEATLKRFEVSEKIVYLGEHKYEKLYTTPKVLAQEKQLVEIMKNGKNEVDPIASKEAVNLYFQELVNRYPDQPTMTNCQKKAIEFLSTTTDRIVGIQGYAGTGKTTMLGAICEIAKQAGYTLRGAAPSAAASEVLREDTSIETFTLSKLIINLMKESGEFKEANDAPGMNNLQQDEKALPELLIIDEASMASTQQLHDLLTRAEKLNKRIILVGDRKQLPAVENGAPFALLQDEGLSLETLIEVIRQKAPDLKFAVNETIQDNLDIAFEAIGNKAFASKPGDGKAFYSPSSTITTIENKDQRLETIANAYLALDQEGRENTIVLLGSNDDRQIVNDYIREGLKVGNRIGSESIDSTILQNKGFTAIEKTHIYNYQIGDIVRFNKAYRSIGIKPFDYCTVKSIDYKTNELILAVNNKEIHWKPENAAKTKGGAVDVFIQEKRPLAKGDYIRWTQNRKNHEIFNTDTAHVLSVKDHMAEIQLKNDKVISLDMRESINKHWDYAWSSTIYAAQGKKAHNVIAQLESYNPLVTHYRSFYVTLSRAVNSIHLYVDNLGKAIDTVKKNTGEKSNATEFLESYQEKLQFEQYIKESPIKLKDRIHEDPNELSRLVSLAKDYAKLIDNNQRLKQKKKIYLVAPDFKDRTRLNALIREELTAGGILSATETNVNALRPFRVHNKDSHLKFSEGMIIGFDRGYKKYGIQKSEYVSINEVNNLTHTVTVKQASGRTVEIEKSFLVERQNKDIGIYKLDNLPLAVGDQIIFDKTFNKTGIIEHQAATVTTITDKDISLTLKNNQIITLTKNDPKLWHWHYAYTKGLKDQAPKSYDIAMSHLDEKTHSNNRVAAIFGALGKAKDKAYLYTHSQAYITHKFQDVSDHESDSLFDNKASKSLHSTQPIKKEKTIYEKLSTYDEEARNLSKAWVSYFETKKSNRLPDENLRNAMILDRAQAELASQITTDEQYHPHHIKALGIDVDKLQKAADKHKIIHAVQRYQQSAMDSASRGYYAREISNHYKDFAKELYANNINEKQLRDESFKYSKRIERLTLPDQTRQDLKVIDAYFENAKMARHQWQRIYRSKDEGVKPNQTKFTFASHISHIRNQLAHEIISHPERFTELTKHLKGKTKASIEKNSKEYTKTLDKKSKRKRALETKNWRQVVKEDQENLRQARSVQATYSDQHKKVYWDKDKVLQATTSRAEQIISSLITEEKNYRLSKGNQIVWGKKHGSVHYHIAGVKEGLVNDYERGIHGDLITYYAKSRGIDWYQGVSELAAQVGLDPNRDSISVSPKKSNVINANNDPKKEKIILAEQKRREKMRQLAQKTWNETKPIAGTIVEIYLKKHRGMHFDLSKVEAKYHPEAPNIVSYKNDTVRIGNRRPAMIVAFKNHQDELTGIQCTYLDKSTANKDKSVQIPKCTIGQIWGSAGIVYRGEANLNKKLNDINSIKNTNIDKIIVAEGFETAASLIPAAPNSAIYITGGNMQNVGNFKFLAEQHQKDEIHIAADNDLSFESGSWKATEAGARQLAQSDIKPLVSLPDSINNQKTDFNDVLKRYDASIVIKEFNPKFTIDITNTVSQEEKLRSIKNTIKEKQNYTDKSYPTYQIPDIKLPQIQKIQPNKQIGEIDRL